VPGKGSNRDEMKAISLGWTYDFTLQSRFHVEAGKFTEVVKVVKVVACYGDDFIGADY
jgi:hypothetical protein